MTEFKIQTTIELDQQEILAIQEIFLALIRVGGLTGVRGGKTVIHFDGEGNFMGVQLDYMPFRRRRSELKVKLPISRDDEENLTIHKK